MSLVPNSCPLGQFYVYLDVSENFTQSWAGCSQNSFFCQDAFHARLLAHPCRTLVLTQDTPVAIANTLVQAASFDPATESFPTKDIARTVPSLDMLRALPAQIRDHPHVYLFESGHQWAYTTYEAVKPESAIAFVTEPIFAYDRTKLVEPQVPDCREACYMYLPSSKLVSVPDQSEVPTRADLAIAARTDVERPIKVFYAAGPIGIALSLRQRLYDLCTAQPLGTSRWYCPVLSSVVDPSVTTTPLTRSTYLDVVGRTSFCMLPAGISPERTSMWDALRRGCIPVLFSSCTQPSELYSHSNTFLPRDEGDGFGVRTWAVLLNQTAVMTSDTYVDEALDAISSDQIAAMRAAVAGSLERITFFNEAADDDALAFVVDHMLNKRGGAPESAPPLPAGFRQFLPPFPKVHAEPFYHGGPDRA